MDYTKRRLLKFTTYGFCLHALGLPGISTAGIHSSPRDHGSEIAPLLESMEAIGREYLRKYPAENSRNTLLSLIESRIGTNGSGLSGLSWDELNAITRDDFQNENVVFLEGWSLARTEARLCALSLV